MRVGAAVGGCRRARLSRVRGDRDVARLEPRRRADTQRRGAGLAGVLRVQPVAADVLREHVQRNVVFRGPGDRRRHADARHTPRAAASGRRPPPHPSRARSARGRSCRSFARWTTTRWPNGSLSRHRRAAARRLADASAAARTAIRSAGSTASRPARPPSSSAADLGLSPTPRRSPAMRALTCPRSRPITSSPCASAAAHPQAIRQSAARSCSAATRRPSEVADFGSSAFSLLRGFGRNTFAGSHVALANADYRWPIARPQRGIGTWPIFLHTIHARGVRRRRSRVDADVPRRRDQDVGRRRALGRHRRRILRCRSPRRSAPRGDTTAAASSPTARRRSSASGARSETRVGVTRRRRFCDLIVRA